ncbi:MarR family winged helix-turn-helix transcriptional regulator [Hymenobacter sp. IS2118]|uniref:MarR family winged helix-turn-helix transcriptional regulator n=1 Tax=Hymenobacter sp. IS2118 TaxID=1505605 RepID=UPI000558B551|nr:MarR family winged helix-turn-helix transcriptional regulator [Hymenobacter sp. IS2118]
MTAEPAPNTPFDPDQQNHPPSVDRKIVAALERLSGVFRLLLWQQATGEGLSPLQLQLLVFLRFHRPGQDTVSHLAREYHVSRPTVSEAVKTLEHKQLVQRHADPADLRSHSLQLTPGGRELADRASQFAGPLHQPVARLPARQKLSLYQSLFGVIDELQQAGVIPVQRMCFSCRFYGQQPDSGHFCHLLQIPLEGAQLRLDCPEHEIGPA